MTRDTLFFLLVVGVPIVLVLRYFRRPIAPVPPPEEHDSASEDPALVAPNAPGGYQAFEAVARGTRHGHRD